MISLHTSFPIQALFSSSLKQNMVTFMFQNKALFSKWWSLNFRDVHIGNRTIKTSRWMSQKYNGSIKWGILKKGAGLKLLFTAIKLHFHNRRNFFFLLGKLMLSPHPHPTERKPESHVLNQVVEGTRKGGQKLILSSNITYGRTRTPSYVSDNGT